MPPREKATSSAGARSKAGASGRARSGSSAASSAPASGRATSPAASKSTSGGRAATVRFHAGWREEQVGEIAAGGKLRIDYAAERLPEFRGTHNRRPTWDIIATALFSPGGQVVTGSVSRKPFELSVPRDATEVTLWFENTDGSGQMAWDSRFGENYRFPIATGAGSGSAGRAKAAPSKAGTSKAASSGGSRSAAPRAGGATASARTSSRAAASDVPGASARKASGPARPSSNGAGASGGGGGRTSRARKS
jgi:hypothetical protein